MNQDKINRNLRESGSDGSDFQRKVLESMRNWMRVSSNKMSEYHSGWDSNSYVYRGYRVIDKDDKDSIKEGTPSKIIVPLTYAQIQTAISFILSTYTQRDNMLELRGTGPEDEKLSFALTTDLSYQLRDQKFVLKLYFWLLDALKQGFGVVRLDWQERYTKMRVAKQVQDNGIAAMFGSLFGREPTMKTEEAVEKVLSYQGNKITNVSPYAFYPDPSVTIANFQEGQFVGHEEEVALSSLKAVEGEVYFGTDKIPDSIAKDIWSDRPRRVSGPFNEGDLNAVVTPEKSSQTRKTIRTEMVVTLSEGEASKLWDAQLGDGTEPVKWMLTMANDQKLIRFENMGNLHGRYPYELFEFSPDHDSFFNPGLADTIAEMQGIVTFFLNSHIVNVKKIISNRFIVDPNKVNTADIENGSMVINTKGAQGDINRSIKQLEMSDVTKGHIADMDTLTALVQMVTGVNENALGQYSAGRRSATEARNVNAGSAARLKMHATLSWLQGVEPFGQQVLSNTRQWRSREVYEQIIGREAIDAPFEQVILADPSKIAGGYDFVPYDATLPTDRQYQASMLQELFGLLVSNPNSMQMLNKNPMVLLNYIAKLYNIKNLSDFDLKPLGPPGPALPPAPKAGEPVADVVPNQEAADAAGGGAEGIDMMGESVLRSLIQS